MTEITEQMRRALRGELSGEEYFEAGMDLFTAGLATLDPLLVGTGDPRVYQLTEDGRKMAVDLRKQ